MRAVAAQAMQDAGLNATGPLRQVLHDHFAWPTTTTMSGYHESGDEVPEA
jgi:hemoglobin